MKLTKEQQQEIESLKSQKNLTKRVVATELEKILFVNMTGSGSTIVGYFNSKKAALDANKKLNKRYKNYWCILSKTI